MALTEAALSSKRARHELRRSTLANGRRTAASSHEVGRIALAAAQEETRAAVRAASAGKRGGFIDGAKSRLFKLMPRRAGAAD